MKIIQSITSKTSVEFTMQTEWMIYWYKIIIYMIYMIAGGTNVEYHINLSKSSLLL